MLRRSRFKDMSGLQHFFSRLRRISRITITVMVSVLVLAIVIVVAFSGSKISQAAQIIEDVPALTNPELAPLPGPIAYYSSDGVLLGKRGVEKRTVLSPGQIPKQVRDATIAIEDQRFYQHNGVDLQGALRALWVDLKARSMVQGGSTITMQYVRNVYLDFSKTANRKLSEVALSWQLEGMWTKERILTAYLNTVYYGQGSYGIEAAALTYFGVPANKLKISQAALLAGLVQNPSALNPRINPQAAVARRQLVLEEMYGQGMISLSELREAKDQPIQLRKLKKAERPAEPALMELLQREARRYLTADQLQNGGLRVTGTFSIKKIRKARTILRRNYGSGPGKPVVSSSFVESDSGRVLLLASSSQREYFDFAWQARRQPGSTVKAFTAGALLNSGGQLSDSVNNSPLKVQNGSKSYTISPTQGGIFNVYDSLRFSQNAASWRLYQKVGPRKVLALEKRFGLTGMDANSAAALGGVKVGTNPMELAGAFSVYASDGRRAAVHSMLKAENRLGDAIWNDKSLIPKQLYPNEYARQMNVALRRVINEGFPELKENLPISKKRQLAGKTGTTENNGDAWFAGYVPQMAGAVWAGYPNSTKPLTDLEGATVWGLTIPAKNFNKLAYLMLQGQPALKFPLPRGVQQVPLVKGKTRQQAIDAFQRFGFNSITPSSQFSSTKSPETVLSQSPTAGSWIKRGAAIIFAYATDQRPAPDLVGRSFISAERELGSFARLNIRFKVSSAALGQIISQQPMAGSPLKFKQVMTVTVAIQPGPIREIIKKVPYTPSGSELDELRRQLEEAQAAVGTGTTIQIVIPSVVGLQPDQAQLVLSSIGLNSRITGSGATVTIQRPAAGSISSASTTVRLTAR